MVSQDTLGSSQKGYGWLGLGSDYLYKVKFLTEIMDLKQISELFEVT